MCTIQALKAFLEVYPMASPRAAAAVRQEPGHEEKEVKDKAVEFTWPIELEKAIECPVTFLPMDQDAVILRSQALHTFSQPGIAGALAKKNQCPITREEKLDATYEPNRAFIELAASVKQYVINQRLNEQKAAEEKAKLEQKLADAEVSHVLLKADMNAQFEKELKAGRDEIRAAKLNARILEDERVGLTSINTSLQGLLSSEYQKRVHAEKQLASIANQSKSHLQTLKEAADLSLKLVVAQRELAQAQKELTDARQKLEKQNAAFADLDRVTVALRADTNKHLDTFSHVLQSLRSVPQDSVSALPRSASAVETPEVVLPRRPLVAALPEIVLPREPAIKHIYPCSPNHPNSSVQNPNSAYERIRARAANHAALLSSSQAIAGAALQPRRGKP